MDRFDIIVEFLFEIHPTTSIKILEVAHMRKTAQTYDCDE